MAVDGIFLYAISLNLQHWIGSHVEDVFQISKFNFVFELRLANAKTRLLVSANPRCARINLTNKVPEHFKNKTAFFLVLNNFVKGSRLVQVVQQGFDRVLFLEFAKSSDSEKFEGLVLAAELVGRHSNLVLFEKNTKKIIDAVVKFNEEFDGYRAIEPQRPYVAIGSQNKLNILTCEFSELIKKFFLQTNLKLSEALVATIEGLSPIVAQEIAFCVGNDLISSYDEHQKEDIVAKLNQIRKLIALKKFSFCAYLNGAEPIEFSWLELNQFGKLLSLKKFETASALLDYFYDEQILVERANQRCYNILKQIRCELNIKLEERAALAEELNELPSPEFYRICADLLSFNAAKIEKGCKRVELEDVYSNGERVEVVLNPEKSAVQNAQAYYKKFKELKSKQTQLENLIAKYDSEILLLEGKLRST